MRIGQGIEFDYCAVQAAEALRRVGWQAVMVNSNPETVSTDFDASSRLYFEPLDAESVLEVIHAETRDGDAPLPALVQFGGQTPLNLADALVADGVDLPGLSLETIDLAEERTRFAGLVDRLGIPQPQGGMATSIEEAIAVADRVGYPVIVRPSFVIGGLAIEFCYGQEDLVRQLAIATAVDDDRPVRIDAYLEGLEVDVDAVCDGTEVLIPGLMEHVERAGVHSGDSVAVFPPQRLSEADQGLIVDAMTRFALAVGVRGLINAQFIVREDGVYLLEVNPRASRTVPFLSKVTGVPMVELATRVALGATLAELGWTGGLRPPPAVVAVKAPVFSTSKLKGVDPAVGPGMRSTGEVIGIHTRRAGGAGQGTPGGLAPAARAGTGRGAGRWCPSPTATSRGSRSWPRHWRRSATGSRPRQAPRPRCGRAGYDVMEVAPLAGARARRHRGRTGPSWTSSRRVRCHWSSTRRPRARVPSGMRPPSVWPRSRRASCA